MQTHISRKQISGSMNEAAKYIFFPFHMKYKTCILRRSNTACVMCDGYYHQNPEKCWLPGAKVPVEAET